MVRFLQSPSFCFFDLFQGVAEAELEQNLSRTFKSFFRASDDMVSVAEGRVVRGTGGKEWGAAEAGNVSGRFPWEGRLLGCGQVWK